MHPILFQAGNFTIYSYSFFNGVAVLVGAVLYFRLSSTQQLPLEKRMLLWSGGLAGGFVGAKLMDVALNFKKVLADAWPYLTQETGSRTILGGIIGAFIGVEIVKKLLSINQKTGDPFALAALAAMGIGRMGCFLGGCCYGKPDAGFLGVYMAGQYRYPTQLMEMVFDFALFAVLWKFRRRFKRPGDLFKMFLFGYGLFRFMIEFIRTEPVVWHGLTMYQLMALPLIIGTGWYFFKSGAAHEHLA